MARAAVAVALSTRALAVAGAATAAANDEVAAREPPAPRVAIVGAGIAGTATAWFLRDQGFDVTLYEANRVGGRVREARYPDDHPVMLEAGGASIHTLNEYMAHFIDVLGLHRDTESFSQRLRPTQGRLLGALGAGSGGAASWDGNRLTRISPASFPLSFVKARMLVTDITRKWQQIYGLQAKNVSFLHPDDMLARLGLRDMAAISGRELLKDKVDAGFIAQFVDGVSRVNYGQDSSLNAFAEAISLAGAGLVGDTFGVREGNSKVMVGLLGASGAKLRKASVTAIREVARGYAVCVAGDCIDYSYVVVAAPLEVANIKLDESLRPTQPPRAYQTTVATFIAASGLNPKYFGAEETVDADTVMTKAGVGVPFNSVAVHGQAAGNKVYKLFSESVPPAELLDSMFVNRTEGQAQFDWKAYPVLRPAARGQERSMWPSFELHSGDHGALYYVNAMESPVSCMETEAVGAKNVALLLTSHWTATKATKPLYY